MQNASRSILLLILNKTLWLLSYWYAPRTEFDVTAWAMQPKNSEIGLSDLPTPYSTSLRSKLDGFVKSPTSALRCIPCHCDEL
jgi:hypothetical protein